MAFLSSPGIAALYSGEEITKASLAARRRRNSSAPGGNPDAVLLVLVVGRRIELGHRRQVDRSTVLLDRLHRQARQVGVERLLAQRRREHQKPEASTAGVGHRSSPRPGCPGLVGSLP